MSGSERPRAGGLVVLCLVAAALGLVGSLVTVAFIKVLDLIHDALWTELPEALDVDPYDLVYVLPVCALGGLLVGVARRFLGEHPESLEQAVERFKRERAFDYVHVPQAVVISLLSLGFGAALGPEAALVAIIGGLGTMVGRFVKAGATAQAPLDYIGVVGALGALFGTAGVAVLPLDEGTDTKARRLWLILSGVAAAAAGIVVFRRLGGAEGYFSFDLPAYEFAAADLGWSLLAAAAGVAVAVALMVVVALTTRVFDVFNSSPEVESLTGGVLLGALGAASSLVLFSGHQGIEELLATDATNTTAFLVAVAVGKCVAAGALLGSGWKGGRFFPIMFAGTAAGLAVSHALADVVPAVAIAAGMSAAVGALIRKPIAAILFMLFIFPVALYPVVVIASFAGSAVASLAVQRVPALDPVGADAASDGSGGEVSESAAS